MLEKYRISSNKRTLLLVSVEISLSPFLLFSLTLTLTHSHQLKMSCDLCISVSYNRRINPRIYVLNLVRWCDSSSLGLMMVLLLFLETKSVLDRVHGHPLLLPDPPFPAAELVFSDAPIPYLTSKTNITLPVSGKSSSSRKKRQTVVISMDQAQYQQCEDVFVNSQFGR